MRLLACLVLLSSSVTLAGPFCVVTSYSKDCGHTSLQHCRQVAQDVGGMCTRNAGESKVTGNAPFCVVGNLGTQCRYYSAPSCQQAAAWSDGVCVAR